MTVRRNFIFQSTAFNTSEPQDYFINECCFGDDLARWLIERLQSQGIHVEPEPGQEDFGWYVAFRVGETDYDLVISYCPGVEEQSGHWMGTMERRVGLLKSLFGARRRGIQPDALAALHAIFSNAAEISGLLWFSDEESKKDENGSSTPT